MMSNAQQLTALFNAHEGPQIARAETSPDSASLSIHVPDDLSWFDGHFPEQKVLPGVVQIDWAGKLAKALFTELGQFKQLSNIKFKTVVMPNTDLELELTYDAAKGNVKFHFFNQSDSYSMGIFKFFVS